MALLITKDVQVLGEFDITEIYIRIHYKVDYNGKEVRVLTRNYTSKAAYVSNIQNLLPVNGLNDGFIFQYDRAIDGVDILQFVHDKVKEVLSTDIFEEEYDASVGGMVPTSVVKIPKYTESSNISIIDL